MAQQELPRYLVQRRASRISIDAKLDEAAWQRAAESHDSAAAWNNLAMLRWQRGDRDGARAALQRALQRVASAEPAFAAAVQETRRTIEAAP